VKCSRADHNVLVFDEFDPTNGAHLGRLGRDLEWQRAHEERLRLAYGITDDSQIPSREILEMHAKAVGVGR
jgi:hypothetical protein